MYCHSDESGEQCNNQWTTVYLNLPEQKARCPYTSAFTSEPGKMNYMAKVTSLLKTQIITITGNKAFNSGMIK